MQESIEFMTDKADGNGSKPKRGRPPGAKNKPKPNATSAPAPVATHAKAPPKKGENVRPERSQEANETRAKGKAKTPMAQENGGTPADSPAERTPRPAISTKHIRHAESGSSSSGGNGSGDTGKPKEDGFDFGPVLILAGGALALALVYLSRKPAAPAAAAGTTKSEIEQAWDLAAQEIREIGSNLTIRLGVR